MRTEDGKKCRAGKMPAHFPGVRSATWQLVVSVLRVSTLRRYSCGSMPRRRQTLSKMVALCQPDKLTITHEKSTSSKSISAAPSSNLVPESRSAARPNSA